MEKDMTKYIEEINIRTDLSVADQIIGAKMNSDGLWITSELKVCGKPTPQAVKEITWAMLEMNKACDLANKGREPTKKKPVKKTVEKPVEKTEDKPPKKLGKKNKGKTDDKTGEQSTGDKNKKLLDTAPSEENKDSGISGGTQVKPDSGEKGKTPSG